MRLRQQSGAHQHKARQPLSQCVAAVPTVLMDPAMGRTAQCHHHSTPQPPTLVQTVHIPGRAVSHTRSDPSLAAAAATAGVKSAPGATETTTSAPTSEAAATTRAKAASPAKSKNEASAGKSAVARGRAAAAATAKNAPAAKEEESALAAKPASRANRAKESRTAARATREGRRARRDAAKSATGAAGAVVAAARETMGESGFATRRTSRMGIRSADGRRAEHIRAFYYIHIHPPSHPKKKLYSFFFYTYLEHLGGVRHCKAFCVFGSIREIPQTRRSDGFERSVLYQSCLQGGSKQAGMQLGLAWGALGPTIYVKRAIFAAI